MPAKGLASRMPNEPRVLVKREKRRREIAEFQRVEAGIATSIDTETYVGLDSERSTRILEGVTVRIESRGSNYANLAPNSENSPRCSDEPYSYRGHLCHIRLWP
jgi:hypothetical protein